MSKYPKQTNPFYLDKRWKRKREVILMRDEYLCRECKRYGKVTPANTVHHIYTLEEHPQYKLTNDNLLSLCNECHELMHNRFENEITNKGKQWMERVRGKVVKHEQ